ncbi:hypothetical protein FOZ62_018046, partial [Perkinsus olseni]
SGGYDDPNRLYLAKEYDGRVDSGKDSYKISQYVDEGGVEGKVTTTAMSASGTWRSARARNPTQCITFLHCRMRIICRMVFTMSMGVVALRCPVIMAMTMTVVMTKY